TEYKTHMSLWAILAAPLLAGNDLQHMSSDILQILTNREVIAVDQDAAGKQGKLVTKNGDVEAWVKELGDGSKAVGLFNPGPSDASVSVNWADLSFSHTPKHVRDLWVHKDVAAEGGTYSVSVPSHGVVLLRVSE
ncbi:MAG: glycoside hydrolase family 27 protein, partial [Acidobacteriaceae bacterium]|nr:glycoside hydrolase family 27 protein [Acidobacteriaceae bacterium]